MDSPFDENSDDKEKIQLLFTIVKNTLMAAVIELKKIKLKLSSRISKIITIINGKII
jgi:hypothetical protein